jgi:hypothetical protein
MGKIKVTDEELVSQICKANDVVLFEFYTTDMKIGVQ